jgi:hypothetical protein
MKSEKIINTIKEINKKEGPNNTSRYNFELVERIVLRLESLSDCKECTYFLYEYDSLLEDLKVNFQKYPNSSYKLLMKKVLLHLEKTHKLITPGHYANTYMTVGIALGLPFGAILSFLGQSQHMGIGLPIGIGLGLLIGYSFDKKAKNAGLTI